MEDKLNSIESSGSEMIGNSTVRKDDWGDTEGQLNVHDDCYRMVVICYYYWCNARSIVINGAT